MAKDDCKDANNSRSSDNCPVNLTFCVAKY